MDIGLYCVYVFGGDGIYKIGLSRNVKLRFETIKHMAPPNSKPIALIRTKNMDTASVLERNLHSFFKKQRIEREWFRLSERDLEMLCLMAKKSEEKYLPSITTTF